MITEAEAFVRHNTHDCLAPHHEKDYRVLQLFASKFMAGRALVVFRVSSTGHLEVDLLRGGGAVTQWGLVVIHRGHMRALPLPSSRVQELVEHFSALGRVVRDLEVCGWASYLEQGDGFGTMMLSKQHPCYRCRMPQTPCRAGDAPVDAPAWDPAEVPELPSKPLRERALLVWARRPGGVFRMGWLDCRVTASGFTCAEPVELYEDPLTMEGVRPEHDLSDPAVADRLRELAKAAPAPDVPNIWQFGSPCTTFCDFQLLNQGTRSFSSPEGDGTRAEELLGNQFADLCAELCESLYTCGREFAFESSAPSGRYPKIWDLPSMRRMRQSTGARVVPMDMCAWYLGVEEGTPGHFHQKRTWWLVSPGLYTWARLFLSRTSSWYVLTAIDAFVASSTGARPVPCLDSCQPWRAFPPPPTRGGGLLTPQGLAVLAWGKEAASALEGTPVLGATDTVAGEESLEGVSKAAKRYLEACRVEYSSEALQQAVKLGSELLRLSGSVEKAAGALNRERVALLGNHLSFTEEGHVIGISDLHKAYLIEMAQQGVPSRREAAPARELAKNHGSVRGHEDELCLRGRLNGLNRDSRSGVSVDAVRGFRVASWTSAQAESGSDGLS